MNQDVAAVLVMILEEVGYSGDKEVFVQKYLALCHFQACWGLVARLSETDQQQIQKHLPHDVTPKALHDALLGWFSDRDYVLALREASKNTFRACFQGMIHMLSESKKLRIQQLVAGISA